MNFGAKSGSSSEYTREYGVRTHDELLRRGNQLLQKGKLVDPKYNKWFKELEKSSQGQALLYQYAERAMSGGFDLKAKHWQPFLKKYSLKATYEMEGTNLNIPKTGPQNEPPGSRDVNYYMNMLQQ